MDHVLQECTDYAAAYLYDIVIHSTSWEDHIHHICDVLVKLREASLIVKCHLAMRNCTYFGHVVGNGPVRPEEVRVQAVTNYPTPTTKRKVHAFLRLTGYYRKFKEDAGEVSHSMHPCTLPCILFTPLSSDSDTEAGLHALSPIVALMRWYMKYAIRVWSKSHGFTAASNLLWREKNPALLIYYEADKVIHDALGQVVASAREAHACPISESIQVYTTIVAATTGSVEENSVVCRTTVAEWANFFQRVLPYTPNGRLPPCHLRQAFFTTGSSGHCRCLHHPILRWGPFENQST